MNRKHCVHAAVVGLVLAVGMSATAFAEENKAEKEKCYGVAKAGKNDCATGSSSCAGTSKADGQKDAFIALPKGTCERLVGGSLESMGG
jgi:uncharacterized membrane protein